VKKWPSASNYGAYGVQRERLFGNRIRWAAAIIRDWWRNRK
jgi:hypothetical protein